jgi:uncharacterized protein YjiS (DUF1127 family)
MSQSITARGAGNPLFALHQALTKRYRNAERRRGVRRLLDLDDAILHDIGVTRSEALHAGNLPLSIDAIAELRRMSQNRLRAARHHKW